MSISSEILAHEQVERVVVQKGQKLHGQDAVLVDVLLYDGRTVEGTFTTESKPGFGGVDFAGPKNIAGLMLAKIDSVLRGTAE